MSTPPDLGPLPEPEAHFRVNDDGRWCESRNGTPMWTERQMRAERHRCYMLGQATASQWRPIETAPKDKTILVWHPSYRRPVAGHVLAGDLWGAFTPGIPMLFQKHIEAPTHWMPLPTAPVEPTKEGG